MVKDRNNNFFVHNINTHQSKRWTAENFFRPLCDVSQRLYLYPPTIEVWRFFNFDRVCNVKQRNANVMTVVENWKFIRLFRVRRWCCFRVKCNLLDINLFFFSTLYSRCFRWWSTLDCRAPTLLLSYTPYARIHVYIHCKVTEAETDPTESSPAATGRWGWRRDEDEFADRDVGV